MEFLLLLPGLNVTWLTVQGSVAAVLCWAMAPMPPGTAPVLPLFQEAQPLWAEHERCWLGRVCGRGAWRGGNVLIQCIPPAAAMPASKAALNLAEPLEGRSMLFTMTLGVDSFPLGHSSPG